MPFKSDRQRKYLYSQKPDVARKFAKHTPKKSALPKTTRKLNKRG